MFFCRKTNLDLKGSLIFGRDLADSRSASQYDNMTGCTVQFKRQCLLWDRKLHLDYRLVNLLEKCSKLVTRNQSPSKLVDLVRCNWHLISFWWSKENSFSRLVNMVVFPISSANYRRPFLMTFNWFSNLFSNVFKKLNNFEINFFDRIFGGFICKPLNVWMVEIA